jgi:ubiquinone/menaquinone biosynthesis C-methylase UbiE
LIDRLADGMLALHTLSPHKSDRHLVDVAAGRGGAAIRAFQKYGLNVTGIDFTEYNVHRAVVNARERDVWPHVNFHMGDAHNLPLASESVSLVWSIESPAHFRDKPRFLCEVNRILKPGGIFAMTELLVVDSIVFAAEKNKQIYDDFLQIWDVPYLESYESYVQAMRNAGLNVKSSEIATQFNLDIYKRYCRWFLRIAQIEPLYQSYKRFIQKKINANLDHVRDHSLHSYQALKMGMIDYGLFWSVKT